MDEISSGRWSRRKRLYAAALLAMTILITGDVARGWWPFGTPSPLPTAPANGRPVLTGVIYSWRGLLMQPVRTKGRDGNDGMLVERVEPGSPAAKAKLEPGDIITEFDGITENSPRSLAMAIADHCCGPIVALSLRRNRHLRSFALPPSVTPPTAVASGYLAVGS
jgi:membrane-associated protease RseP (regulator of RpoE activity)